MDKKSLDQLKEVIMSTNELNMSNYNHEDVRELNDAMIEIYQIVFGESND